MGSRTPDRYYAATAQLAANGRQAATMRVVAICILSLGTSGALECLTPSATRSAEGRLALAVLTSACLVLGVGWLRARWPSRIESAAVVVFGATALSVGCLAAAQLPVAMAAAASFAVVLGYAALLHRGRLLGLAAAIAAVVLLLLGVRLAVLGVGSALAALIPLVLIDVVVVLTCRVLPDLGGIADEQTEVDLVTGLPTRDSFDDRAATLLGARHRDDDRYLALTIINIDALGAIAELQGSRGFDRARTAAAQAVRESVRRGAVVGHAGESEFVVADTFTTADPSPLVERLRGAIASTPCGITASIGVVSTQLRPLADRPPGEVLDQLIDRARAAMDESRKAGGNQARYLVV